MRKAKAISAMLMFSMTMSYAPISALPVLATTTEEVVGKEDNGYFKKEDSVSMWRNPGFEKSKFIEKSGLKEENAQSAQAYNSKGTVSLINEAVKEQKPFLSIKVNKFDYRTLGISDLESLPMMLLYMSDNTAESAANLFWNIEAVTSDIKEENGEYHIRYALSYHFTKDEIKKEESLETEVLSSIETKDNNVLKSIYDYLSKDFHYDSQKHEGTLADGLNADDQYLTNSFLMRLLNKKGIAARLVASKDGSSYKYLTVIKKGEKIYSYDLAADAGKDASKAFEIAFDKEEVVEPFSLAFLTSEFKLAEAAATTDRKPASVASVKSASAAGLRAAGDSETRGTETEESGEIDINNLKATYGQTLSDVKLPADYTWVNSHLSVGDPGKHTFDAYHTVDGAREKVKLEVTVEKAQSVNPIIAPASVTSTWKNGMTLADISLISGWAFKAPETVPEIGTHYYDIVFTPSDTTTYKYTEEDLNKQLKVTIKKATPDFDEPSGIIVSPSTILLDEMLPTSADGTFKWSALEKVKVSGTYYCKYIPNDDHYLTVNGISVPVIVEKGDDDGGDVDPTPPAPSGDDDDNTPVTPSKQKSKNAERFDNAKENTNYGIVTPRHSYGLNGSDVFDDDSSTRRIGAGTVKITNQTASLARKVRPTSTTVNPNVAAVERATQDDKSDSTDTSVWTREDTADNTDEVDNKKEDKTSKKSEDKKEKKSSKAPIIIIAAFCAALAGAGAFLLIKAKKEK